MHSLRTTGVRCTFVACFSWTFVLKRNLVSISFRCGMYLLWWIGTGEEDLEELGFVSNDKFQASFVSLLVRVYHQSPVTPYVVYTLCSESCCRLEAPRHLVRGNLSQNCRKYGAMKTKVQVVQLFLWRSATTYMCKTIRVGGGLLYFNLKFEGLALSSDRSTPGK
jgi:hypothetical protein